VVKHLDQMNIWSELFLKEKRKQDIVKDLKMAFGDNIVSEYYIIFSCSYDSNIFQLYGLTVRKTLKWDSNMTFAWNGNGDIFYYIILTSI
jgi:hypothetical protein